MNFQNRIVSANLEDGTLDISFPYSPDLVEVVRGLPDRKWVKSRGKWTVPYSEYHCKKVVEILTPYKFDFDARVERLAAGAKKTKVVYFPNRDGLFEFQSEAVEFTHQRGGRVILGDEMGLGKTIEALAWVRERPDLEQILIVCPASVVYKWEREIKKWVGENETVGILLTGKQPIPQTRWLIMSYAIMTSQQQQLRNLVWDLVIFDEAHKLKEPESLRSRCAATLPNTYAMLLTGTPMLNRPRELFNLLHYLNPNEWDNFFSYAQRYCDAHKNYFGWDFTGASNLTELNERLKKYMIRRTKKEVLTQLPDLTRTRLPVECRKDDIQEALESLKLWLIENGSTGASRAEAMVRLSKLRQAVGISKVKVTVDLAQEILDENSSQKLVIYAVHKSVVSMLEESLKDYHVSTITGETAQEERQKRIDNFQNHPYPRVMIISSAGGEGIDLFRADKIIFAEREWTPASEEQAEARCHRMGQKNAVEALYLIASGTIDVDMDMLIESKRDLFKTVVGQDVVKTSGKTIDEFFALIKNR